MYASSSDTALPRRWRRRWDTSRAAFSVNVITTSSLGGAPTVSINAATRATTLVVLPLPAPADPGGAPPGASLTHLGNTRAAGEAVIRLHLRQLPVLRIPERVR